MANNIESCVERMDERKRKMIKIECLFTFYGFDLSCERFLIEKIGKRQREREKESKRLDAAVIIIILLETFWLLNLFSLTFNIAAWELERARTDIGDGDSRLVVGSMLSCDLIELLF